MSAEHWALSNSENPVPTCQYVWNIPSYFAHLFAIPMKKALFAACVYMLFFPLTVVAQDRFDFDSALTYNSAIPSPASFLGYEHGEKFTFHAHMLDYFEALAEASDRVTLHEYGHSHEGRQLVYAVITSPQNQARINDIRTNNLRLADPTDEDALSLIEEQPLIHWMSYNVHGNEPSSTESAMQVSYRLAAAEDAETLDMLENVVVIIDPCLNPDGRDRYTYWYTSMHSKLMNTNADDLEHSEPWPGGRTNHYWFDLNRDWVWLVHPESQGRIKAYQHWMPQVHIDYHEQGFNANYFTHPGTTPRNLNLPDAYNDWEEAFGFGDAKAFDEHQISYFTRERFDFYYPGYGSSYPSLMGSIGMLREQGGHSRGGRAVETNDGYVLTLRQRIFDHYLTSFAGIKTSLDNREELLRYFREALTPGNDPERREKAYILPDLDNMYTHRIVDMMMAHGVDVERAEQAFSVTDARDYWTAEPARMEFDRGTYLIRTDQPRHLFINTIMQRQMAIEDSIMYDMATWSAPMAYNVKAAWTERDLNVNTVTLAEAPGISGSIENADASYAYVIDWKQTDAPKALAHLWKLGYNVRSIQRPFYTQADTLSRGSLVVLLGRNRDKLGTAASDMENVAQATGVHIIGLDSGWSEEGLNPASSWSIPVDKPNVAMLVDPPFNSYTAGQLWFLFEEWTEFPINRIRVTDLPGIELEEYDVLLLPGIWGGLGAYMDSSRIQTIKQWVRNGGTLIGTEGSARFLTHDQSKMTPIELAKETEEKDKEEEEDAFQPGTLDDPYVGLEAREDLEDLDNIPGSALRGFLDVTHPLAYGMDPHLYSLKFGNVALEPSVKSQVVGYYHPRADSVLASGYMSIKNREKLAGKAFAMVHEMGRGKVALLHDNTQYRMFWVGPSRLMQNAVMILPNM